MNRSTSSFRKPLLPAFLAPLGREVNRRQADGSIVRFRSIQLKTIFEDVYSQLDGFASDWETYKRLWLPVDGLEDGQHSVVVRSSKPLGLGASHDLQELVP